MHDCLSTDHFFDTGPELRFDYRESRQFGLENTCHIIRRTFLYAFKRLLGGDKKALHLERIRDHPAICSEFKFPPRLFTRSSIADLAQRMQSGESTSLLLRYVATNDALRVFHEIHKFGVVPSSSSTVGYELGTSLPPFRCRFDIRVVLRGLIKIGVNLLAAYCGHTPVNCGNFADSTSLVLGFKEVTWADCTRSGFIDPECVRDIARPDSHSFRLQFDVDRQVWSVYSVFFGGKVASLVEIAGPSNEPWSRADIFVPLNSRAWSFEVGNVLVPLNPTVTWDVSRILSWLM